MPWGAPRRHGGDRHRPGPGADRGAAGPAARGAAARPGPGAAKRGKSTLINALLGRDVLPTGVTPLTAVATTVRYGDDPHVEVRFSDGHEEKHPMPALPDLVTERGTRVTGGTSRW